MAVMRLPIPCSAERTAKRLGAGRMARGQRGEIDPGNGEVVEIAVVETVQLVQRPLAADPLPRPEHELAEKALLRTPFVAEERRT